MSFRAPPLLLAVPLLGIARLLPETGFGLWLRLAAATLVVLLPGRLLARALGLRGAAAGLSWSTALVAGALALTFAVGGSLDLTLALVLSAGAIALLLRRPLRFAPLSARRGESRLGRLSRLEGGAPPAAPALVGRGALLRTRGRGAVVLAGLALGGAIWFVEGVVDGDSLFHLGRVRKLVDLPSLSLSAVGEFAHGGLHPGYAFPLWHGWLALVAKVGGVDPTGVVLHESSLLVPLALLLAFEAGIAVFGSAWLGAATMLAQVALIALAPGGGGAYTVLTGPGTAARQLFVPAAIALFFLLVRTPTRPLALTLAAASTDLAFVHPTYALFLALPLVGFVAARALLVRGADLRRGIGALVAFLVPMGLVFVWLKPIVDQTLSVNPGPQELRRALHAYASDLVVRSTASYHLAPGVLTRTGAVAVAGLVVVPLALAARRHRWGALVLGGTVLVLALELWPLVFPRFADAVSLSQARRAAGFVPLALAFAGGALVLARRLRLLVLPVALAAGIALQLAYPGDFGIRTTHSGPALPAWIALFGGLAALLAGIALAWLRPGRRDPSRRLRSGPTAAVAAALFVLPVAVHGFADWSAQNASDPYALSSGLVAFLQRDVPRRAVVFADLETSYRVVAFAPVYVVGAPPAHVANTKPNRVRERRLAVLRFLASGDLRIPRRWGAQLLVLRRSEPVAAVERQGLRPAYEDGAYVAFRLPPPRH